MKLEKQEMDRDRILTHSRFNSTLRIWLVHSLLLLRNVSIRKTFCHKQHKTYFCEEGQLYALSSQNIFKISRAIVQETKKMLSATEILSASVVKRLVGEQGRFLKRE